MLREGEDYLPADATSRKALWPRRSNSQGFDMRSVLSAVVSLVIFLPAAGYSQGQPPAKMPGSKEEIEKKRTAQTYAGRTFFEWTEDLRGKDNLTKADPSTLVRAPGCSKVLRYCRQDRSTGRAHLDQGIGASRHQRSGQCGNYLGFRRSR